jgi:hypothetical protein
MNPFSFKKFYNSPHKKDIIENYFYSQSAWINDDLNSLSHDDSSSISYDQIPVEQFYLKKLNKGRDQVESYVQRLTDTIALSCDKISKGTWLITLTEPIGNLNKTLF